MKNNKNYNESEVLQSLRNKKSIKIQESTKTITAAEQDSPGTDVGIKAKGKLDYLAVIGWHVSGSI